MNLPRRPHAIKVKPNTNGYPTRIIAFDTETHPSTVDDSVQELTLGWAVFKNLEEPTKNTSKFFTTIDEFWNYVEFTTQPDKPTYLIAHNVAFDFGVMAGLRELTKRGWESTQRFLPDPTGPFKMSFTKDRRTIHVADSGNWWGKQELRNIGAALNFPKGDVDASDPIYWPINGCVEGTPEWNDLSTYCERDTEIVAAAVRAFIEFCLNYDLGPFAMTLAGQAFNAYSHRFMEPESIFIHTKEHVINLEKEAYFGGLTDCYQVGLFEAPEEENFHIYDFKSMYPSVMATMTYPTKFAGYEKGINVGRDGLRIIPPHERVEYVSELMEEGYAVIARIQVDTDRAQGSPQFLSCVPHLHDDKLLYNVGQYETVVCSRELQVAIQRGIVADITELAYYEQEVIFKDYVEFFFEVRAENKGTVWDSIAKLFLNSLYGKFGQATYSWEVTEDYVFDEDGSYTDFDEDGKPVKLRQLGGICEIRSEEKSPGENSFFAIAAHVTSDGRAKLRRAMEAAKFENVYYGDTDSIFVNETGSKNLMATGMAVSDGAKLGELELEKSFPVLQVNTLKDYVCLDREGNVLKSRMKGVRANAVRGFLDGDTFTPDPTGDTYQQVQFEGMAGRLRNGRPNESRVMTVYKRPTHKYNKGTVLKTGVVRPFDLRLLGGATDVR